MSSVTFVLVLEQDLSNTPPAFQECVKQHFLKSQFRGAVYYHVAVVHRLTLGQGSLSRVYCGTVSGNQLGQFTEGLPDGSLMDWIESQIKNPEGVVFSHLAIWDKDRGD